MKNANKTPICETCGVDTSHLKYSGRKLFPRTCSPVCRGELISKEKKKPINGVPRSVIAAQKTAETRKMSNNYFSAAKKASETKRLSGVMKLAAKKRLLNQSFDEEFSRKIKNGMNVVGPDGITAAQRAAVKANETKIKLGKITSPKLSSEFSKYKKEVLKITRQQPLYLLENIEKRGHISKNGWQLDHVVSIFTGFHSNIPPEKIGHISNLRMMPGLENIKKSSK
jgi:hypothetical protein